MKRQIVLIILLIAAIGYAGYMYMPVMQAYLPDLFKARLGDGSGEMDRPVAEPAQSAAKTSAEAAVATAESGGEQKKVKKDLVDPFALRINIRSKQDRPKEDQKEIANEPDPTLEGIWVDSGMRVAFISNQAVVEGGMVMDWRVSRITKTQVTLTKGSRRKILKLEAIQ